jgi:hypothetical protein
MCVCIWLRRYKVKEPNAARWIHPVVQASVLLPLVRICLIQYASNLVKIASERATGAAVVCARVFMDEVALENSCAPAFFPTFVR